MMYGRRPLTKVEAGLFAGLVAIFIVLFARQMLEYMEIAERATMEATLVNTMSAINVRLLQDIASQRNGASDWTRQNPFDLARMAPANFAGELRESAPASGSWGYDSASAELIYTPRLHFKLQTSNGEASLRFRLVERPTGGYNLAPTTPYRWE
jgi:hypothetical protein